MKKDKLAFGLLKLRAAARGLPPWLSVAGIEQELTRIRELTAADAAQAMADKTHEATNEIKRQVLDQYQANKGKYLDKHGKPSKHAAADALAMQYPTVTRDTIRRWLIGQ